MDDESSLLHLLVGKKLEAMNRGVFASPDPAYVGDLGALPREGKDEWG